MDSFIDSCRFAKVVETTSGRGVLIGGQVFIIDGPGAYEDDGPDYSAWFVTALRRTPSMFSGLGGGVTSINAGVITGQNDPPRN